MAIKTSDAVRRVAQLDGSQLSDYMALLKPRVMSLVVFTGFAGMVVAPGELGPLRAAAAVLCIAAGAGAAAAINMWFDRDIDAFIQRTRRRAIPRGSLRRERGSGRGRGGP